MFLSLSKTLDVLAAPLSWAMGLALLGLLLRRRPRLGPGMALLGLAVLLVFSCEPVAGVLAREVEASAHSTFDPAATYDVVIVLGGIVDPAASAASGQLEVTESADRIMRAGLLLKAGKARMILLSGGLISQRPGELSEADRLAAWLREDGIGPDRIVIEDRSRNTHENAVESVRMVAAHGWKRVLLLTSAWHAPRAFGCFRAAGLVPDVLPVDHRATDSSDYGWLPRAAALALSTDMLREVVGRLVYRAVGYSR